MKKFDFCIGNPPYMDQTLGDNDKFAPPVYDVFMDAAYQVSDRVAMITPGRFLFNAGATPKSWNEKMLNDKHFKVLMYETDTSRVFPNQAITGGIAITYRNATLDYGAVEVFSPYKELNSIRKKVESVLTGSVVDIAYSAYSYHLTQRLYDENPHLLGKQSKGHDFDLKSNVFSTLNEVFCATKGSDTDVKVLGRVGADRVFRWIKREYIQAPDNLDFYKVVLAGADGAAGTIGNPIPARIAGMPTVAYPGEASTESFSSLGKFSTREEAEALMKYIKTRFTRTLLSVLKVTQNITPEKWKYVPLQNFSSSFDIDWSKSIAEIDQQLYKKYGLSDEEISFIETHVKEMA